MKRITIYIDVPEGAAVNVVQVPNAENPEPVFDGYPIDDGLAHLPPVQPQRADAPMGYCPTHRVPFREVPGGVSKRTGKAYQAFWACPERDCDQRPVRVSA